MRALAIPAIGCGLALLALDLYLMEGRQSEHWRAAVVAQAAVGGTGGFVGVIFLTLMLLNLVLWIADRYLDPGVLPGRTGWAWRRLAGGVAISRLCYSALRRRQVTRLRPEQRERL
jgi:hypothetical protein